MKNGFSDRNTAHQLGLVLAIVMLINLIAGASAHASNAVNIKAASAKSAGASLPGDPVPPLLIRHWLQKGVYDEVRPTSNAGRLITVIEFWASWCPLSRAILPMHDKLQAELKNEGVRFVAVGEDIPEDIFAFQEQAGLKNIAITLDDEETILKTCLNAKMDIPIPFAVILADDKQGSRMLWKGPVVSDPESWARKLGYTYDFDTVLTEILEGRFDVNTARELELTRVELCRLTNRLQALVFEGRFEEVKPLARELLDRDWPPIFAPVLTEAFSVTSWFLVDGSPMSANKPSKEDVAFGLEMARAAVDVAEEENSVLLHVYARALFENDEFATAVEIQRKALEAPRPSGLFLQLCWIHKGSYEQALRKYRNGLRKFMTGFGDDTPSPASEQPARPPETITGKEAAEDLKLLHEYLHLYYPGYDDLAWELAGTGQPWEQRNTKFLGRIAEKEEWPLPEFYEIVMEYLEIIKDLHFSMNVGFPLRPGGIHYRRARPTRVLVPFFADLRIREEEEGHMLVRTVPDDLAQYEGAEIIGVSVIGNPKTAVAERAYLFPTLSRGAKREYLLGMLADESAPPVDLTITIDGSSPGQLLGKEEVKLPLHRGRAHFDRQRNSSGWSLALEPVPVLAVRRMSGDDLAEMPKTAEKLREYPLVILDLRNNCGGSDVFADEWTRRFTSQKIDMFAGIGHLRPEETDPLRRWNCFLGDTWIARLGEKNTELATSPYSGRLFVITDKGAGSAAEGFIAVASQIEGAVVVGENSAGCCAYGNLCQNFSLPNSGFRFFFGASKGAFAGRVFSEGAGFFPDYWLDTEDPLKAVMEFAEATQPALP